MTKTLLTLLLLVLITAGGCISTYVGDPEKSTADDKLLGLWHTDDGSQEQLWAIFPLDKRSYLVQAYLFDKKDGKLVPNEANPIVLHGWLTDIGGERFMSLKWFTPKQILNPSDQAAQRYAVARVNLTTTGLTARGLKEEFVKALPEQSPKALEAAIAAHLNEDSTYNGEPQPFTKVDPAHLGKAEAAIKLIDQD